MGIRRALIQVKESGELTRVLRTTSTDARWSIPEPGPSGSEVHFRALGLPGAWTIINRPVSTTVDAPLGSVTETRT